MVEKLKRFFMKFQMASCISWQSSWHPPIIIWNLDICLWISKKKLKRQAYGFTKPLVVCQNFAGWSVLAQLVFAGLQYPLSEPIPCVPCLLSDLNPSCNPPNHFFAKKFFMYLIFFSLCSSQECEFEHGETEKSERTSSDKGRWEPVGNDWEEKRRAVDSSEDNSSI